MVNHGVPSIGFFIVVDEVAKGRIVLMWLSEALGYIKNLKNNHITLTLDEKKASLATSFSLAQSLSIRYGLFRSAFLSFDSRSDILTPL